MSQRNKLTIPIKMINKMTALMTTHSTLWTLDSDPIISCSVNFYLIDFNIRNIQKHIKSVL